jgi:hypothetical protein
MTDISTYINAIVCQQKANIAYELIRAGQQHPDYLRDTLASLDADCVPTFLQQLSKRIKEQK